MAVGQRGGAKRLPLCAVPVGLVGNSQSCPSNPQAFLSVFIRRLECQFVGRCLPDQVGQVLVAEEAPRLHLLALVPTVSSAVCVSVTD